MGGISLSGGYSSWSLERLVVELDSVCEGKDRIRLWWGCDGDSLFLGEGGNYESFEGEKYIMRGLVMVCQREIVIVASCAHC